MHQGKNSPYHFSKEESYLLCSHNSLISKHFLLSGNIINSIFQSSTIWALSCSSGLQPWYYNSSPNPLYLKFSNICTRLTTEVSGSFCFSSIILILLYGLLLGTFLRNSCIKKTDRTKWTIYKLSLSLGDKKGFL